MYFEQMEPLLSAATYLSFNEHLRAIQKLLLANQPEFAFVLSNEFEPKSHDHILTVLLQKTIYFQQSSITNKLLESI